MFNDNQSFSSSSFRSTLVEWSVEHDRHNDFWELMIWHRGSPILQKRIRLEAYSENSAINESVKILARDYPDSYFSNKY